MSRPLKTPLSLFVLCRSGTRGVLHDITPSSICGGAKVMAGFESYMRFHLCGGRGPLPLRKGGGACRAA